MKAAELVKLCANLLKSLSESDIKIDDYRHVDLYDTYVKMRHNGCKKAYIVAVLSERFGMSEASVWRLLRRFGRDVTP